MLGPGLLIAIPYFLALLLFLFELVPLILLDGMPSSSRAITVLVVLFGLLASHYVAAIAGAVGMIIGAPRWLSITTCIGAMLPTILITNLCIGFLLYPVVLGGCIWGLISLLGNSGSRAG